MVFKSIRIIASFDNLTVLCQSEIARYEFIKEQSGLSKRRLFHLFEISSSGYYAYLKRSPSLRSLFNQEIDKKIKELFELHRGRYGYRRLHNELLDEGYYLSRVLVRRRMYKLNLKAKQRTKYKHTTDSNHNNPALRIY